MNLGIIATELSHSELPSTDMHHQARNFTSNLPVGYSDNFTKFVASCLQKQKVTNYLYTSCV